MAGSVKVEGLREFQRALAKADPALRREIRAVYREVGDVVKADAASRFSRIDSGSAAGFKTRVRQRGVSVEQSRRRVTGKRGDYGALQMRRALVPALGAKQSEVMEGFEQAIDKVADIVEG